MPLLHNSSYRFPSEIGSIQLPRKQVMPFSQSSQISTIVQFGEELKPASILDVGVGMGQYGFLFRTNLENIGLFDIDGAHATWRPKERWSVKIDGIEGCKDYITPVHEFAYNTVMIGDALECLAKIADRSYEFVIAIDILEHFWKDDGWRLLSELTRVCSRAALVSTPKKCLIRRFCLIHLKNSSTRQRSL